MHVSDRLCVQGERDTNELNNKLAQFSENAMKFTMDGGLSAYDYKAEDEEVPDDVNYKALAGEWCCHLHALRLEVSDSKALLMS